MGWIANLSDGRVVEETEPVAGQMSAWQKLLAYCKDNNVAITALRLVVGDVTVEAMSSKRCSGYFQAYEASRVMFRDTVSNKQGIGSVVGDLVYITWINIDTQIDHMNHIYQDVRPLAEVKIHTAINEVSYGRINK